MTGGYYDREGRPISYEVWRRQRSFNKQVAETRISDGKVVSTVWTGLSASLNGPPKIFETVVFSSDGSVVVEEVKSETEAAARDRHAEVVESWERNALATAARETAFLERVADAAEPEAPPVKRVRVINLED